MAPLPDSRPTPPRRRWLRVSLRGLMLLVVLIGGVAGWLANTIRAQRQAIAAVRASGGEVYFDFQAQEIGKDARGRPIRRTEPSAPRWLRSLLGDELFQNVDRVSFSKAVSPDVFAALANFDRMGIFQMEDATGVGNGFCHLRGLSQMHGIFVGAPGLTDEVLNDIARISAIRTLVFGKHLRLVRSSLPVPKSPATDEGFTRLAALPNLETLEIDNCPNLTDLGAARLVEGLPSLRALGLKGWPKSLTATLQALARHHPELTGLVLDRSGVTDDDLKAVEGLTKLTGVNLQAPKITDSGLAHFRPLKNLTSLLVNSTDIGDGGLEVLGGLPLLQQLFVNKTKVTDAGVVHLEKLANLKRLALGFNQITDAAMPSVAKITSLEQLELSNSPLITDAGLVPLRGLKKLQQLDLSATKVTPEGIAALQQALPTLSKVTNRPPRSPAPTPTPTPAAK